jgi:hypothetical protein
LRAWQVFQKGDAFYASIEYSEKKIPYVNSS